MQFRHKIREQEELNFPTGLGIVTHSQAEPAVINSNVCLVFLSTQNFHVTFFPFLQKFIILSIATENGWSCGIAAAGAIYNRGSK